MASPKTKTPSKSTKYFRKNPKARKKKDAISKKINKRPDQKAKRRKLSNANYAADKRGTNRTGKDLSHTSKGLRYKSVKANRGDKNDSRGDARSRGRKKKR